MSKCDQKQDLMTKALGPPEIRQEISEQNATYECTVVFLDKEKHSVIAKDPIVKTREADNFLNRDELNLILQ